MHSSHPAATTNERWLLPSLDRQAFREGVRDIAGPSIGIAIWGVITGVALVSGDATNKVGLTIPLAIVLTLLPFAGSAQLGVLPLLAVHAPLPIIWITAALINLRFVINSAATRAHFVRLPLPQKILTTYLNGDVGGAMFLQRWKDVTDPALCGNPTHLGYFYGLGITNWIVWMGSSIVGIFLGEAAPTSWGLDLGATLALIAVLIPMIRNKPMIAGVLVTAAVATMTNRFPMKLGLLVAVIVGVVTAFAAEHLLSNDAPQQAATR